MSPNTHISTGVAFGFVSANLLDSELVDQLMYGSQATNLSEQAAQKEEEARQRAEWEEECERLTVAAQEAGTDLVLEDFEANFDGFESNIEEPEIEGVYEGVFYLSSWLGGALNFFITQSPFIATTASRSSPCVPGAGILKFPHDRDGDVMCYDVAPTWWHVDPDASTFEEKLEEIEKEF